MAVYSHDFKLEFDGHEYDGEIEFNDDGIASYSFDNSYDLTIEQMDILNAQMNIWHRLFHVFGGTIKLVRLKEKTP